MELRHTVATTAGAFALLGGLLGGPLAPAATAGEAAAPGVAVDVATKAAGEVREYWTPERMKEALAHPEPLRATGPTATDRTADAAADAAVTATDSTAARILASADAVQPTAQAPAAASSSSTTESTESKASTEASAQVAAADIAVAQDVPASTSIPNVVVGKLFGTKPNGAEYVCSASVIVSDTANTIWTAGHCVHEGDGSGDAGWYSNIKFVPGYKDGQQPWGEWEEDRKYAPEAWTEDGDQDVADMAAVVLKPNADYGNIQDNIGGLGYQFGSVTDYSDAFAVGYPVEGYNRTDMDGEQMMYCFGNTEDASSLNPLDGRLKMDCDMGAGASGGPMFIGALGSNPQIIGAVAHHEADATTGERVNDDLFSSLHDLNAVNVINTVNDSV